MTASLVFGGAVFWLLLSLPIGVLSALKPRSIIDRAAMTFVLFGISAHPVWIGLILAFVFGYELRNFPIHTPITGYCDFFNPAFGAACGGPVQWAYHMILPWSTFMLLFAALYVRLIRANVMETMNEDYVRTARAKGAPERRVMCSTSFGTACCRSSRSSAWTSASRSAARSSRRSIFGLPGLGRRVLAGVQPERPAGDPGGRRLRDDRGHHLQPDRRPPLRLPRPADPARNDRPSSRSTGSPDVVPDRRRHRQGSRRRQLLGREGRDARHRRRVRLRQERHLPDGHGSERQAKAATSSGSVLLDGQEILHGDVHASCSEIRGTGWR